MQAIVSADIRSAGAAVAFPGGGEIIVVNGVRHATNVFRIAIAFT
jgi:hypothetical protein